MAKTIEKNGFKLTHSSNGRFVGGWEFSVVKPDGSTLIVSYGSSTDPDADAIKELDRAIQFSKDCIAVEQRAAAARWVKDKKSGCEIKIYAGHGSNHSYIIRKGDKTLFYGSSGSGAKAALINAKSQIRRNDY
jgi:hypothetical protein